jgi:hypothetical protein
MTGIAHPLASQQGSGEKEMPIVPPSFHPAVDAYLAEVKQGVRGLVPRERIDMYLGETADWILCRAKMLETEGFEEESALRQAVIEHEDPKQLAVALIEDYFESQSDGPLVKRMGRANAIVFTIFGLATGVYFLLLQVILAFPNTEALKGGPTPAQLSRYYPAMLPYPEPSWQFILACGVPVVLPFALGWLAGHLVPVRARESVAMGLFPIVVFSAFAAALLLPDKTGVLFTLFLVVFWLPVASQMAHFSSLRLRSARKNLSRVDGEADGPRSPEANH